MNAKLPMYPRQAFGKIPVFEPTPAQILAKRYAVEALDLVSWMRRECHHFLALAIFMLAVESEKPLDAKLLKNVWEEDLGYQWSLLLDIHSSIELAIVKSAGRNSCQFIPFGKMEDIIADAQIVLDDVHKYCHPHQAIIFKQLENKQRINVTPVEVYREWWNQAKYSRALINRKLADRAALLS